MPSRFPRAAKGEARTDRYALLYWHVNGNWGLWIIDHKAGISRLRSASREVRVQAVNVMPDLIDGLQDEGEDYCLANGASE